MSIKITLTAHYYEEMAILKARFIPVKMPARLMLGLNHHFTVGASGRVCSPGLGTGSVLVSADQKGGLVGAGTDGGYNNSENTCWLRAL